MRDQSRLRFVSRKLMAVTACMVMRYALFSVERKLIAVTFIVTGCLGSCRDAIDWLCRTRETTRPDHQDEKQRTQQDLECRHESRP